MEVDSVGIFAILSMSYITTRIVKTQTSVVKIPKVPVENQITALSVVKIAIKCSPCTILSAPTLQAFDTSILIGITTQATHFPCLLVGLACYYLPSQRDRRYTFAVFREGLAVIFVVVSANTDFPDLQQEAKKDASQALLVRHAPHGNSFCCTHCGRLLTDIYYWINEKKNSLSF